MTTTSTKAAEEAIRQYLLYLEDPSQLRDEATIAKCQQDVQNAVDPIDKLKSLAALERATVIDETPLRQGFIDNAQAWAHEARVPASAFVSLHVPAEVLQEAGLDVTSNRKPAKRAKAVPLDDIKEWVLRQTSGTFTLLDIGAGAGGASATVRKAVDELIEAGAIESLGRVSPYDGRGRAPNHYRTVTPEAQP